METCSASASLSHTLTYILMPHHSHPACIYLPPCQPNIQCSACGYYCLVLIQHYCLPAPSRWLERERPAQRQSHLSTSHTFLCPCLAFLWLFKLFTKLFNKLTKKIAFQIWLQSNFLAETDQADFKKSSDKLSQNEDQRHILLLAIKWYWADINSDAGCWKSYQLLV